jgi:hypothetical protein
VAGTNLPETEETLPATSRCETTDTARISIGKHRQGGPESRRDADKKARAFDESEATNFEDHSAKPESSR